MEDQIYPSNVNDWDWDTIELLSKNDIQEHNYLEYKKHLTYPSEDDIEKSEKEWRKEIERELTAFANGSGGILVFGMSDDVEPTPFEPPEHEVRQPINQYIHNTTPIAEIEVSDPLLPPSKNTNRMAIAVRVFQASRKPVKTSDSAYFVRVNDQKHPMSREQLESMFVEADRRQQAVRHLELEISRFRNSFEKEVPEVPNKGKIPPLESIDETSLREVFRQNTHLFSDEEVQDIAVEVMGILDEISAVKRVFREGCRNIGRVQYDNYGELNRATQIILFDLGQQLKSKFETLADNTQMQIR